MTSEPPSQDVALLDAYPPQLTDEQLDFVLGEIEDYQLTHGSVIKYPRAFVEVDSPTAIAKPIGVSIFPTPFPRRIFNQAWDIQLLYNELYAKIAEDDVWLGDVLAEVRESDDFVAKLWSLWERVKEVGDAQPLRCSVWRSDYMLHQTSDPVTSGREVPGFAPNHASLGSCKLKQVEFNTYSCAGGSHANIIGDMHQYLASRGTHQSTFVEPSRLPKNKAVRSIVSMLERAHRAYGDQIVSAKTTAILMTVQPNNVNIADERPIQYGLAECDPPVVLFRAEFSHQILRDCRLGPDRELIYQSPTGQEFEISVIYQRAGYDPHEYVPRGIEARFMLEQSRAIKCPTLLSHISGFKKVQQELAKPGILERFLYPLKAAALRETFMPMYPMDASAEGLKAQELALNDSSADNYILKPSLEGGGHNFYGSEIRLHLENTLKYQWRNYILMEKIKPPLLQATLVSPQMVHDGPVVSELGIIGTCIWHQASDGGSPNIVNNTQAGWTFKTKPADVKEMSVIKGYGCFDSPCFMDEA